MKQGNRLPGWIRRTIITALLLLMGNVCGWAQDSAGVPPPDDSTAAAIRQLQQQISELRAAVGQMRDEAAQYRAENAELRRELHSVRSQLTAGATPPPQGSYGGSTATKVDSEKVVSPQAALPAQAQPQSLESRVASLEESAQLLNSKVDDQYQTKVESGSKYRVRLSGLVLLNLFSNRGATDNADFPSFVIGPGTGKGNFGATLRQSEIGLEVFGPTVVGAKTSANLQADFAGGSADTWNGVNSGIFRLRIASMRMDWEHTSIVAGQDDLFLSPLAPTSFASLAVPALNYAGNLWAWTPQVRVEHRFDFSDQQNITVQGGIFDNLSGEFPASSYFRQPQTGELSRQPAYGFRTAWTRRISGRPLTFGAGGYYSRQDWAFEHYIDGWAGMADWQIPLAARLSLSGEFYRGRAIGGIGGNISQTVVFEGDPTNPATPVRGLDSIGGWSQLKYKATNTLEFNTAFGLDNPTTAEVRAAALSQPYLFAPLRVRNHGALANFVYRPRSNLLFSAEYRYLQTLQLFDVSNHADQVNLMMGILF